MASLPVHHFLYVTSVMRIAASCADTSGLDSLPLCLQPTLTQGQGQKEVQGKDGNCLERNSLDSPMRASPTTSETATCRFVPNCHHQEEGTSNPVPDGDLSLSSSSCLSRVTNSLDSLATANDDTTDGFQKAQQSGSKLWGQGEKPMARLPDGKHLQTKNVSGFNRRLRGSKSQRRKEKKRKKTRVARVLLKRKMKRK